MSISEAESVVMEVLWRQAPRSADMSPRRETEARPQPEFAARRLARSRRMARDTLLLVVAVGFEGGDDLVEAGGTDVGARSRQDSGWTRSAG